MHDQIAVIAAEGKANHEDLIRLIVYFHVPRLLPVHHMPAVLRKRWQTTAAAPHAT